MANEIVVPSEMKDTLAILKVWEDSYEIPTFDPVPCLTR